MAESELELHPEALKDALAGYAWYLEHSEIGAGRFLAELDRAVQLILEAPQRWPTYVHGTRRFVLIKFPYSVVYRESKDLIVVYAFAHSKRRPGYWKERLGWSPPSA